MVVYLKKTYSFFEKFYRKSTVKCRKKLYFLVFLVDIWNVYGVKGEIVWIDFLINYGDYLLESAQKVVK